jgi:hypothetical protein
MVQLQSVLNMPVLDELVLQFLGHKQELKVRLVALGTLACSFAWY